MADTDIEWADKVWNPVTGCDAAGAGCLNCYAKRMWPRLSSMSDKYRGREFSDVRCHPEVLLDPLKWNRKKSVIFVNSMGDLFHKSVPDEFLDQVFAAMLLTGGFHQFVILTKRPERMRQYVDSLLDGERGVCGAAERLTGKAFYRTVIAGTLLAESLELPGWIAVGASASNQRETDRALESLMKTRAAKAVVSLEPLLGPVCLEKWLPQPDCPECGESHYPGRKLSGVIVGGETGPGARPTHVDWVRFLRDQCAAAGVPFFFKQWGEWLHGSLYRECLRELPTDLARLPHLPAPIGQYARVGKRRAGDTLDGKKHRALPWRTNSQEILASSEDVEVKK